jgi:hypothetical protein
MKHVMELFVAKEGQPDIRVQFDLPGISVDDFDPRLHFGKMLLDWCPSGDTSVEAKNLVRVWEMAYHENENEKNELISSGKMKFVKL